MKWYTYVEKYHASNLDSCMLYDPRKCGTEYWIESDVHSNLELHCIWVSPTYLHVHFVQVHLL